MTESKRIIKLGGERRILEHLVRFAPIFTLGASEIRLRAQPRCWGRSRKNQLIDTKTNAEQTGPRPAARVYDTLLYPTAHRAGGPRLGTTDEVAMGRGSWKPAGILGSSLQGGFPEPL